MVKGLTSAQVMISRFLSESQPCIWLCADSLEPGACFRLSVSLSLCPIPACALSLSLSHSLSNKHKKKKDINGKEAKGMSLRNTVFTDYLKNYTPTPRRFGCPDQTIPPLFLPSTPIKKSINKELLSQGGHVFLTRCLCLPL